MERTYKLSENNYLDLFSSGAYLVVNKKLLQTCGPTLTIYLSNLIDVYKYFYNKEQLYKDKWFFSSHKDQMESTGLTNFQLKSCKRKLKDLDILEIKKFKHPAKEHYLIKVSSLIKYLKTESTETSSLESTETSSHNKHIKTKTKQKSIKNKRLKTYQYFPNEWQHNKEFRSSITDFSIQRSKTIYPLSEIAIKKMVNKLTKFTIEEAIFALDEAVVGGYRGLFPKKMDDRKPNQVGYKSQVKHTKGQKI